MAATKLPRVDQLTIDAVFLHFLIWECEAFDDARKRAVDALDEIAKDPTLKDPTLERRAFSDIQAAFVLAANVGKMLWPTPGTSPAQVRAQKRGARLRSLLNIHHDATLENRKLRKALEHFDERLDDWARAPRDMIVNQITSDPTVTGWNPKDVFGLYDPATFTMTVLGQSVNLDQLCNAVWGVLAAATVAMDDVQRRRGLP